MPAEVEWIIQRYAPDATSAFLQADLTSRSLQGESDMHVADDCRLLVSNCVRLTPARCVIVLANQGMVE
jgi:hypothetical protein